MKKHVIQGVVGVVCWASSAGFIAVQAASLNTTAVADAFVAAGPTGGLANNNYGGGGALAVAAASLPNGEFQTVIRFDLASVRDALNTQYGTGQWSVQSAVLQLGSSPHTNPIYNDISAGAFGISLLQNNSWVEGTGTASKPTSNGITFNSLQNTYLNATADQPLGTFSFPGGASGLNQYSLTLAPQLISDIASGSNLSLRLFAADNGVSYLFSSRAADTDRPELIINAIPEPRAIVLFGLGLGILMVGRPLRGRRLY